MDNSKRQFLKASVLFAPIFGGAYYYSRISYEKLIEKAIHTRLHYLKLNSADVRAFAKDYALLFNKSKTTVVTIDLAVTAKEFFPGFTRLNERVNSYEDYIVIKFLESSDFFLNNGDEQQAVKYLGIDQTGPYNTFCQNPFANFDLD